MDKWKSNVFSYRLLQQELLTISQKHYTNQVIITLMTTLLPDRVTFIFPSREIVTASGNRIYLFSFPQESFHFRILLLIS